MYDQSDYVQPAAPKSESGATPRVVIVGAGFAGTAAARALRDTSVEVIIIDRRNHYLFQPLLYQVATSVLSESEVAAPIRQLIGRQKNVQVVLGEVTGIDTSERVVVVDVSGQPERKVAYDFLILATGTQPSYFGNDHFARFAPGLKTLTDARAIRGKILSAFERAEVEENPDRLAHYMTFVVVGGGPAGVELAASLAQMASLTLRSNFKRIDPAAASIILLEGGSRILAAYSDELAEKASTQLCTLGVTVRCHVMVNQIDEHGVVAGETRIPSATVIWTAGVEPHPLGDWLHAPTDRAGRVIVGPFLEVPDRRNVFVIGDTASIQQDGKPVPGVAQAAMQQGKYVGQVISSEIRGVAHEATFRYLDKGSMAVVGKNFAILEAGRSQTSGRLTWLIWVFVHIMSLPHAQNRMRVYIQWIWSYFTGQRSSRLIAEVSPTPSIGIAKSKEK